MPRLSSASKKAANSVASKLSNNASNSTKASNPATQTSAIAKAQTSVVVPGLMEFTPNNIQGMLPQFDEGKYQVTDPLNPPADMPQVSQQQFDKNEAIYQGGIRALKVTGLGFDLAKERFVTLRKKVSAFGSGVKLSTEVEKVKGDFLDYLNQGQINQQKNIALGVSQHKTTTDTQKAVYDVQSMDDKLDQSRIAAELAKAQTTEKLSGLQEFQKQLSGQI
jgi:hypothetical protein